MRPDELEPIVQLHEHVQVASIPGNLATLRTHVHAVSDVRRQGLGRLAVMELATWYVPEAQRDAARTLAEHGAYYMFKQLPDDVTMRRIFSQLYQLAEVPRWGRSTVLACLFGAEPATFLGGVADLAFVSAGDVRDAARELEATPPLADRYGADRVWRDFVRTTGERGEALAIHWAYR